MIVEKHFLCVYSLVFLISFCVLDVVEMILRTRWWY